MYYDFFDFFELIWLEGLIQILVIYYVIILNTRFIWIQIVFLAFLNKILVLLIINITQTNLLLNQLKRLFLKIYPKLLA